jgi:hypothetical protein
MRTFVSKNALPPFICFEAVKLKSRRQRTTQLTNLFYCLPRAVISRDFELAFPGNLNFNLVAFFKIQRFHYSGWKTDR